MQGYDYEFLFLQRTFKQHRDVLKLIKSPKSKRNSVNKPILEIF